MKKYIIFRSEIDLISLFIIIFFFLLFLLRPFQIEPWWGLFLK